MSNLLPWVLFGVPGLNLFTNFTVEYVTSVHFMYVHAMFLCVVICVVSLLTILLLQLRWSKGFSVSLLLVHPVISFSVFSSIGRDREKEGKYVLVELSRFNESAFLSLHSKWQGTDICICLTEGEALCWVKDPWWGKVRRTLRESTTYCVGEYVVLRGGVRRTRKESTSYCWGSTSYWWDEYFVL